jgi:hypothetical protein
MKTVMKSFLRCFLAVRWAAVSFFYGLAMVGNFSDEEMLKSVK